MRQSHACINATLAVRRWIVLQKEKHGVTPDESTLSIKVSTDFPNLSDREHIYVIANCQPTDNVLR